MNIWLDDLREAPQEWAHVHNLDELAALIDIARQNSDFSIDTLSFDFHLSHPKKGVDVIKYLADLCIQNQTKRFWPRTILYHSNDPEGVKVMKEYVADFESSELFNRDLI